MRLWDYFRNKKEEAIYVALRNYSSNKIFWVWKLQEFNPKTHTQWKSGVMSKNQVENAFQFLQLYAASSRFFNMTVSFPNGSDWSYLVWLVMMLRDAFCSVVTALPGTKLALLYKGRYYY